MTEAATTHGVTVLPQSESNSDVGFASARTSRKPGQPMTSWEQRELLYALRREATVAEEKTLKDRIAKLDHDDQYAIGEVAFEASTLMRGGKPLHEAWGAETFEQLSKKFLKVQATHAHNCKRVWGTFFHFFKDEFNGAELRKIPIARLMELVGIVLDQPTRARYWVEQAQSQSASSLKAMVLTVRKEAAKAAKLAKQQAKNKGAAPVAKPTKTTTVIPRPVVISTSNHAAAPVAAAPVVAQSATPTVTVQGNELTFSLSLSTEEAAGMKGWLAAARKFGSTKSDFELAYEYLQDRKATAAPATQATSAPAAKQLTGT